MTNKPKFNDIDYIDPDWGFTPVLPRIPEQDTDELLPCPFCGGNPERSVGSQINYNVFCTECNAQTGWYETKELAGDAWNRRI